MKIEYVAKNFRTDSLVLIDACNVIITKYNAMGFSLTLRQLYYQLVGTNAIRNTKQNYKNLSALLTDARMAGLVDWNALEDRTRNAKVRQEFESPEDLMEAALAIYRLPRRETQPIYVELWVEKDALNELCGRVAREHHITHCVNKGYSSASAMHVAANRIEHESQKKEQAIILYMGDHDPSGEDMVRDIQERMTTFGVEVEVIKIALTMDQIQLYKLPPNPTKMTDNRAPSYIATHGDGSWELDALAPDALMAIADAAVLNYTDQDLIDEIILREDGHKEQLESAAKRLSK